MKLCSKGSRDEVRGDDGAVHGDVAVHGGLHDAGVRHDAVLHVHGLRVLRVLRVVVALFRYFCFENRAVGSNSYRQLNPYCQGKSNQDLPHKDKYYLICVVLLANR